MPAARRCAGKPGRRATRHLSFPTMNLILQVFVIFAAAKAAGELCVRLGLPAIVGELLVGVGLGPHALGWVEVNQATSVLSELGIVVLLFVAGLETRLSGLLTMWRTSAAAS